MQVATTPDTKSITSEWIDKAGINLKTINVVGTVDLQTKLELRTIALHARNAEYNPKVRRTCVSFICNPILEIFSSHYEIKRP